MKLLVVAAILALGAADRLDNRYLPPRGNAGAGYSGAGAGLGPKAGGFGAGSSGFGQGGAGSSGFGQGGAGFGGSGSINAGFGGTQHSGNAYNAASQQYGGGFSGGFGGRSNSADASAQILRQNSEVTAEGFSYDFETSNGIRADAQGVATNGVQSQGSFAYKGDDGQDYSITYTADENGYRPQGAHLPTPPPIPEAILKSLEQNARDEAAGIVDDGAYHGEGAGAGGYSGNAGGYSAGSAGGYSAGSAGGYSAGNAGPSGGFSASAPSNQYGAPSRSSGFGGRTSNFGAATSRQYLTPNARPSGSGNFNAQSGYRY